MAVVADASVTLSWLLADERDDLAVAMLHALARAGAIVPALWRWEVQNALLAAERRGRLQAATVGAMLADLERLPIAVDARPPIAESGAELTLARKYRLTAYDAAYLELAFRKGMPLMTRDRVLAAAAADLALLWIAEPS